MHQTGIAILVAWWVTLSALGAGDDLLSLADRAAEGLTHRAARVMVRGALHRETPMAIARQVVRALDMPPGTELHLLGGDGHGWCSTVDGWGQGPASREDLWLVVSASAAGVTSEVVLNDSWTELVRREVGWKSIQAFGIAGTLVVEQVRGLEKDPENPWSGKWIGAYSRQGMAFDGTGASPLNEASTLSAILLQSGSSCWVRLVAADHVFESRGTIHEDTMRCGAAGPVRILELNHSPADDRLRGALQFVSPDEVGTTRIFLQRVPAQSKNTDT